MKHKNILFAALIASLLFSASSMSILAADDHLEDGQEFLEDIQEEYEDITYLGKVEEVDKLICAIGEVTIHSEESIRKAREAYDALTDQQRALSLYGYLLFEAEDAYQALVSETKPIHHKIEELDCLMLEYCDISYDCWDKIVEIQNAYASLSEEEKAQLVNANVFFTNLEAYLASLEESQDVPEQQDVIKQTASEWVDALIQEIGTVNEESIGLINKAREAYDALSQEDKQQVKNYQTLVAAENTYQTLINKEQKTLEKEEVSTGSVEPMFLFALSAITSLGILIGARKLKANQ